MLAATRCHCGELKTRSSGAFLICPAGRKRPHGVTVPSQRIAAMLVAHRPHSSDVDGRPWSLAALPTPRTQPMCTSVMPRSSSSARASSTRCPSRTSTMPTRTRMPRRCASMRFARVVGARAAGDLVVSLVGVGVVGRRQGDAGGRRAPSARRGRGTRGQGGCRGFGCDGDGHGPFPSVVFHGGRAGLLGGEVRPVLRRFYSVRSSSAVLARSSADVRLSWLRTKARRGSCASRSARSVTGVASVGARRKMSG